MSLYRPIPPLTLAANVEAPLSPKNWRDYGKLLYWIFFFPQAIRDYVTPKPASASPPTAPAANERAGVQATMEPTAGNAAAEQTAQATARPKQAALVQISTILLPLLTLLMALLSAVGQHWLGDLDWRVLLNSGIGSVPLGLILAGIVFQVNRVKNRPAHGIVLGVATGVTTTLISMFALGEFLDDHFLGMGRAVGYGFLSGSGVGILSNLAMTLAPESKAQPSRQPGLIGALVSGIVIFVINGFHASDRFFDLNISQENWLAVLTGMAAFFGGAQAGQQRPLDWLLGKLFLNFQLRNIGKNAAVRPYLDGTGFFSHYAPGLEALFAPTSAAYMNIQPHLPHVTLLPIRQLPLHLQTWLDFDWEAGLANAAQLWRYTNQYPVVVEGIHQVLEEADGTKQVEKVAQFVNKLDDAHWPLILYPAPRPAATKADKSKRPSKQVQTQQQRQQQYRHHLRLALAPQNVVAPLTLPMEKPAQQAIAGFWHLRHTFIDESIHAFRQLPDDALSKELLDITQSIQKLLQTKNLVMSPTVELPARPKEPKRKATWDALEKFKPVVRYGWLYHQCKNEARRDAVVGVATHKLDEIHKDAEKVPQAERPLIIQLTKLWREEFQQWTAATRSPQRMKPENPFIFLESLRGRPPFVGREGELKALKVAGSRGSLQPVLISGLVHSGKSSLVQKAMFEYKDDIVFVTFAILDPVDGVISPKQVLWAMYHNLMRRFNQQPLTQIIFDLNPEGITEEAVRRICARYGKTTLVFAVDNVERLYPLAPRPTLHKMKITSSAATGAETIFAFWAKLAAIGNLSFIFISPAAELLDTPFTPNLKKVPVSNLTIKDLLKLLTTPTPEFIPLFAPEAVEHIYELTNGQPYLVQLIAHGVVDRMNQTLDKDEKLEPVFLVEDVDAVVEGDAFGQFSGAYFATLFRKLETLKPGSTTILRTIAQDEDGISDAAIEQALAGQYEWAAVESSLAFLASHQLIRQEQGEWLVVGALLRRAASN